MYLLLLHVALVIVFGIAFLMSKMRDSKKGSYYSSNATGTIAAMLIIFITILIGHLVVIGLIHLNEEKDRITMEERRKVIEFQIEHDILIGDTLLDYNTEVTKMKYCRKSPWLNWYEAPYVDDLELIKLE